MYWDGEKEPSVEVPWAILAPAGPTATHLLAVCVEPGQWSMLGNSVPVIRQGSRWIHRADDMTLIINDTPPEVPAMRVSPCAVRRVNPLPKGSLHILEGVKGRGHYVGTYRLGSNKPASGARAKSFLHDGDSKFRPTATGTRLF